jgi:signal transduction histidine kinase
LERAIEVNPRLRLTLAVVALTAGLIDVALIALAGSNRPAPAPYLIISIVGVSWSFVAAGLIAWSRRPGNRTGALMVAVGMAYALHGLVLIDSPLTLVPWLLLNSLPEAILAHLIAVFPDGRVTTRVQRLFVVANYAATVPLGLVGFLVGTGVGGDANPAVFALAALSNLTVLGLAALLLWIVATRWRQASRARRRSLAPVALVGVALLVGYLIRRAAQGFFGMPPSALADALDLFILATLMLWPVAFLIGLARLRLDRSAVGELAIQLGQPQPPGGLERALASALHDPTVRVAYWLPERDCYVDADGHRIALPTDTVDRAVTVLAGDDGAPLAALLHDPALREDPGLIDAVAATARMAIVNERLRAEVRAQLAEVRASRIRIVEYGTAERRRVERNLHDGAQQRLVNLSLALGIARAKVGTAPAQELSAALDNAAAELRLALSELRELARGIHPVILSEAGLGPALTSLAGRSPVPVDVLATPAGRLPPAVEETAYYVVAEALTNAAKHANATSVTVSVRQLEQQLLIQISDDGGGGADPDGSGLRGLADRVAALDGRLHIRSPVGGGTRITAELPCG